MQQQQPAMQQPIMAPPAPPAEGDPIQWRKATVIANVLVGIATFMVVLGLVLKTILYIDVHELGESASIKVSYYGVKTHDTPDRSLDEATCDRGSLVRFAGALHYFAFFSCVVLASCLGKELKTSTTHGHLVTILFVLAHGFLFLLNVCLAAVRGHANEDNCQSLDGLIRYGVGSCWGLAIGGQIFIFWAGVGYICSRYFKCCCYSPAYYPVSPATGGYQQPAAGQPVAYQQVPANYQPQPGYQQQPAYQQQQPQGYQQQAAQGYPQEQQQPVLYQQAPPQQGGYQTEQGYQQTGYQAQPEPAQKII